MDFTAKRYGVLPSDLAARGDTLDLQCAEIGVGYEAWVQKNPKQNNSHGLTQDDMLKQLEAVRNAQNRARQNQS